MLFADADQHGEEVGPWEEAAARRIEERPESRETVEPKKGALTYGPADTCHPRSFKTTIKMVYE